MDLPARIGSRLLSSFGLRDLDRVRAEALEAEQAAEALCQAERRRGRRGGCWHGDRPPGADAQHGGRDAASAGHMVRDVLGDAVVDGAASAARLVPHAPSAGSPAGRGNP
jgi:hypothetical protein